MSREQDAKVAELVMGWTVIREQYEGGNQGPVFKPSQAYIDREFRRTGTRIVDCTAEPFTSDVSADYLVLEYVRENWDRDKMTAFNEKLRLQWTSYDVPLSCQYVSGDWSRAALAVVEAEPAQRGEDHATDKQT